MTLPGRTFAYLFDPSALSTLRGHDIEYERFVATQYNLAAQSLTKGKGDPQTSTDAHNVYIDWEKDCEEKRKSGFFDDFDNIVLDSFTTFSDMVMDRVLFINGRAGKFPQEDDWPAQMTTISNVIKTFVVMGKTIVCLAHDEMRQDGVTKRVYNQILLTGRLRVKIPLLFSEILKCECASTPQKIIYQIQTRPNRDSPAIRCTIRGLKMYEDVTIPDNLWNDPRGKCGLGKLLIDNGLTKAA